MTRTCSEVEPFADVIVANGLSDLSAAAAATTSSLAATATITSGPATETTGSPAASGMDSLYGGAGVDTADYSEKTEFVEVTLNGSTSASVLVGGVVEDTLSDIESLVGGHWQRRLPGRQP